MKVVAGIVGGFFLALVGAMVIAIGFAARPVFGGSAGVVAFFVLWAVALVIAINAKTPGKAWRYVLITTAVVSFMLPLSGVLFTGTLMDTSVNPNVTKSAGYAAGTVIGGGLVSGFLGFVGFFIGLIFLVIGLLVGRDKEVVYVQMPAAAAPPESPGTPPA